MPIRFRCGYCNRLLAIARRKAGMETTCPHCGYTVTVPEDEEAPAEEPEQSEQSEAGQFEDLDGLMNPYEDAEPSPPLPPPPPVPLQHSPRTPTQQQPRSAPAPVPARAGAPKPFFERDIDSLLGDADAKKPMTLPPPTPAQAAAAAAAAAMDARNLESDQGKIVLSVQMATMLAVGAIVLLGLSFAVGFLVGTHR